MAKFKVCFHSQEIQVCSQHIYRLLKKMLLALMKTAPNIAWLSTEFKPPYNNNNIN